MMIDLLEKAQIVEKKFMEVKRLLVDLDGVVVTYDFAKIVWDTFHVRIDASKIRAYNLADVLGVSSKRIDEMFHDQVWGKPQFNESALEVLKEWKTKYIIAIYSNRIKYMGHRGLERWLLEWQIPFSAIDTYGTAEYFAHIDDRPEKLCDTDSKVKLLFNQPWNQECFNIEGKLTRVYSWQEIREIIG